jgi:hypothetical protein
MFEEPTMQTKLKIAVLCLSIAATFLTAIAYAIINTPEVVGNQGSVGEQFNGLQAQLWLMYPNCTTGRRQITTLQWGNLTDGETYSSYNQIGALKIKNPTSRPEYVAWQLDPSTPLPSGFILTARYVGPRTLGYGYDWLPYPQNAFLVFVRAYQFSADPTEQSTDPNIGKIEFDLTLNGAAPGPFNFNILLKAADSASG